MESARSDFPLAVGPTMVMMGCGGMVGMNDSDERELPLLSQEGWPIDDGRRGGSLRNHLSCVPQLGNTPRIDLDYVSIVTALLTQEGNACFPKSCLTRAQYDFFNSMPV